jgi:hypothetical protein
MKIFALFASFTIPLFCYAGWVPPKKPNPERIFAEAKADTKAGRHGDALAKHVWFHENALKYGSSLRGVRLSLALSAWADLGSAYPPAMEKLREIRDDTSERVKAGKFPRDAFQDLLAIDRQLGEETKTIELFSTLDANGTAVATEIFDLAQPMLVRAKEYKLCAKYLDPDASLTRATELFRMHGKIANKPKSDSRVKSFGEQRFTNDVSTLVALLAVNKRKEEAARLAQKAKAEWNQPDFHSAIDQALMGEVPQPWP